ncbi:MAG: MFS transporter, partial [Marinoscillum sp.]
MKIKDIAVMITLMIIGEVVFILPFVIVRIFRPTFLTVFDITNLELGTAFSAYGIVAMAAYFFGGPLADRFPPGRLIALSLIVTSLGGLVLITIPNIWMLVLVYAFFGASTILLFWSAFVKVQRQLGMVTGQGKSFGMVDAGRGLIAAFMASTSVFLLDGFLEVDAEIATRAQFTVALQWIIGLFTLVTIICALLEMLVLDHSRLIPTNDTFRFKEFRKALSNRVIWQHALIVMCAYVGYKCTDDFSLFARDTFNYDDVEAAHLAAVTFWTRPLAAVICGVLADKWLTSKVVGWC